MRDLHRAQGSVRPAVFGALALSGALALTACGGGTGTQAAGPAGIMTVAMRTQPSALDPAKAANGSSAFYQELAYDSLIDQNAKGTLIPGLATQWGYQGTGSTKFSVTLRSGVKFADGEPMTPKSVADSINYFAKNGTGPASAAFATISAVPVGSDQVLLTSSTPDPIIPDLLSPTYFGGNIISPKGLAKPSALTSQTFGAGPYVLDTAQSVDGDHYTYVPNKNFYDQSRIHNKQVILKVISNPTAAVQALRAGQVDVVEGGPDTVSTAKAAKEQIFQTPSFWDGMFIDDWGGKLVPALGDVRVRQAMNYAIDRTSIAQAIYGNLAKANDQPNTPGWDAYDTAMESRYPYDPAKAKQLLAQAGYPNGFTMKLIYAAYEAQTTQLEQAMAGQLGKVGIKVELTGANSIGDQFTKVGAKQYSAFALAWGGKSAYAQVAQVWLPNSGNANPWHSPVTGLSKAFAAYSSASPADKTAKAAAVEKVVVDQALTVPVIQGDAVWYASPRVKGFALMPQGDAVQASNWQVG